MTEIQATETDNLIIFDNMSSDINIDIENTSNTKINKYFIKHKFIEKVCKLTGNKLFVNFYIDFFDNYNTKSPQVVLFINDLKKFLEKNNHKSYNTYNNFNMIHTSNLCNINLLNNLNVNNLYSINNITIGNIISVLSLSSINNCYTLLLNKSIDYVKSFVTSSYNIFIYIFDYYREYFMFGNKELVNLCMRLDFTDQDVYKFGQDVINL
jgi:hypothetical protein